VAVARSRWPSADRRADADSIHIWIDSDPDIGLDALDVSLHGSIGQAILPPPAPMPWSGTTHFAAARTPPPMLYMA
jgi:hypothetical protein